MQPAPAAPLPTASKIWPPIWFGAVSNGIYRSAYPTLSTYSFLERKQFKTLIALMSVDPSSDLAANASKQGVKLLSFDVGSIHDSVVQLDQQKVSAAINAALNPENHPVLMFCLNGRIKTSYIVGCLRRLQDWSMAAIQEEFELFCKTEGVVFTPPDFDFIENFQGP